MRNGRLAWAPVAFRYHGTMYSEWYARISRPMRSAAHGPQVLAWLDKGLVCLVAALYVCALLWLALDGDARLSRLVAVPAVGFVLCTALRAAVDAPRPYELYDIQPLIAREKRGHSFPSRHIFSAVVIAYALAEVSAPLGIVGFLAAAVVCCCRVLGGVHFPRDVVAAVVLALVCGAVGFTLMP